MSMADANLPVITRRADKMEVDSKDQLWTTLIILVVILGVATGVLAMFLEASIEVYVAFFFPIILGPAIIIQAKKLERMQCTCLCLDLAQGSLHLLYS